ncbi:unnamed protein product [Parajaminaea phylloscopi]
MTSVQPPLAVTASNGTAGPSRAPRPDPTATSSATTPPLPSSHALKMEFPGRPHPPPPPLKRASTDGTRASEADDTADEGGDTSRDGNGTPNQAKKAAAKKKKANRACAACQRAHLTCDDARPCSRCVKKGIGDQCTDGKRKRAKYLLDEDELEAVKAREKAAKDKKDLMASSEPEKASEEVTSHPTQEQPGQSTSTEAMASNTPFFAGLSSSHSASHQAEPIFGMSHLGDIPAAGPNEPSLLAETDGVIGGQALQQQGPSETTPPYTFGSEATSLEYSILSAMLNGIDPSLLSGSPDQGILDGTQGLGSMASVAGVGNNRGDADLTPGGPMGGSSLDLSSFFGNGAMGSGQNLPSVGMATDTSSYWLNDASTTLAPTQAPSPWPGSAMAPQSGETLGQLHEIGGQGTNAAEGEVGSGGFKALEVPSPSPSMLPVRLDGSSPADSFSSQASGTAGGHRPPRPPVPQLSSAKGRTLSAFEAQWRERVNHIYGDLTRPFPYTEEYHFLLKFVTDKFEKAEVLRIVRALGLFRPSLIALQMPLTEEDEVFVERSIQRTILEFEKLISFSGTPTVVWRRTCEICVVGSEFSMLTGWTRDNLLGRRIYEFWDKNSTLEYWEKFASHAFENTSQSIVANVVLKRPDGSSVPCAACFSIKRNVFDLPSLIVGAFLPMLSSTA